MHAVTRRYQFEPSTSDEIARQVDEGFLPMITKIRGFMT